MVVEQEVYSPKPGERKGFIGASDAPAIMGVSPFRTAYDVWAEKTDKLLPETDKDVTPAMNEGKILEPAILTWAEGSLGTIKRNVEVARNGIGFPLIVHLDGVRLETDMPVEAKTSGLHYMPPREWGEDGSDDVPDYVIIQTQTQLLAYKQEHCYIPALLGGRGFVMFNMPKNSSMQEMIQEQCGTFWNNNVLKDIPPEDTPTENVYKRIRRKPIIVPVHFDILADYSDAADAVKAAEKVKNAAKSALMRELGDAEVGEADGYGSVSYREQSRDSYTVSASTFRVLRVKKVKVDDGN